MTVTSESAAKAAEPELGLADRLQPLLLLAAIGLNFLVNPLVAWALAPSSGCQRDSPMPVVPEPRRRRRQRRLHVATLETITLAAVIVSMFASQANAIFDDKGAVGRLVAPMILFFALAYAIAMLTAR